MDALQGMLTISRPQCSNGEKHIRIELVDKNSGCQAFEVEIPLENFAEALTGLGHAACKYDFNDSGVLGKNHETKVEKVHILCKPYADNRDVAIKRAFEKFEVDGWKGYVSDAVNSRRIVEYCNESYWVNVAFHRYV